MCVCVFNMNSFMLLRYYNFFGEQLHQESWGWLETSKRKIEEHNKFDSWSIGKYVSYYFEKKQYS